RIFKGEARIKFSDTMMAALEAADALVIVTEWKEFGSPDFSVVKQKLKANIIFDGRNIYDPTVVQKAGIEYHAIGRIVAKQG
ncbi:MAG: UDP binding domain-containing protein, partial [Methylophilus sp.]